MLIGIPPIVGPDLLYVLHRMGHGDELVLADAFFAGDTYGKRIVRMDGIRIAPLLDAILSLIPIDTYVSDPVVMMQPVEGDSYDPSLFETYWEVLVRRWPETPPITRLERFAFYERASKAYAVVMTGETTKYGNIIIKKGVVSV
ncbi:RbsD or FucU transport [Spirochaeta thermophila DSM 6578]|uniref:RbsD or FucU transport n=1 Tax=Winmispira thermophila (strain ATCC 700085 / DSM 6578 / Z-1203) TaxID=869211 RepID=G0GEL8_WINT7|nr:L-fucose mutarotase [Spirochaeta thermophila]AEJ60706.1 RbsD or FucU transport [Spirochaeta thermophila DSM 6578]